MLPPVSLNLAFPPPGIFQFPEHLEGSNKKMAIKDKETIRNHWRCFVACGLMVLSPFQYGIDFGLIGGLQAMPGFLKVTVSSNHRSRLYANDAKTDLRPPSSKYSDRLEYIDRPTAANHVLDDPRRLS